jgi:ABC-2 type transport system ATP-binding protein
VIVMCGGRVIADATPDQLRTRGAGVMLRYRLPLGGAAAALPAPLRRHLDPGGRELLVRGPELPDALEALVGWARDRRLDLAGLEVGPPSLEDAYLALTAEPETIMEVEHHG